MTKNKKGFTLVELLIYIAIFVIVIGLLTSILVIIFRIQNKESSSTEVTSQLNFVMQKIQGLVRESSAIIVNDDGNLSKDGAFTDPPNNKKIGPYKYLILRTKDHPDDPICVYLGSLDRIVKLVKGGDPNLSDDCDNAATTDLSNNKVNGLSTSLAFTKIVQYPGHDTVNIDLIMDYNTTNPQKTFTRKLASAIGRVSAATFDDNILPGTDGTWNIGSSNRWKNAYFTESIDVSGGSKGARIRLAGAGVSTNFGFDYSDQGSSYLMLDRLDENHDASIVFRDYNNGTGSGARGEIGIIGGYSAGGTKDSLILKTATGSFGSETYYESLILKQNGDVVISGDRYPIGGGAYKGGRGKLGINTNTPTDILHVANSLGLSTDRTRVKIENVRTSGSMSGVVEFKGWGGDWTTGIDSGMSGVNTFFIRDEIAQANRLTIDSSGNVNINGNLTVGGTLNVVPQQGVWCGMSDSAILGADDSACIGSNPYNSCPSSPSGWDRRLIAAGTYTCIKQ